MLCVVFLFWGTACNAEPVQENKPGAMSLSEITQAPEVNEAIEKVKDSLMTEDTDRRAVVILSDNGIEIAGDGCETDGSRLKIKEGGVYEISGTMSDGCIYVNADKESEVQLIFNGVSVHNETSAAVYCKKAARVTITLAEGSVNTLSDGETYVFEEGEDEPDATLYAKNDLVINGGGTLTVTSAYKDAIKGKDSLYILEGTLTVDSAEDGIVGRDLLYIAEGNFTVGAAADALKASNDVDEGLGNITIDGGLFSLTAGADGIQAENTLVVTGGTFVIKTGGGSVNAPVKTDSFGFGGGKEWGGWGDWGDSKGTDTEDTASAKGLKSGALVSVTGGHFTLDTSDDAIHCNTNVAINGGDFTILSGDDGVHADETLQIDGEGKIRITKSYEGLEALNIVVAGGEIEITASDDGLNAAGGADGSGVGRPGMGMFGEGEGEVTISGGTVTIDAGGDGLDSNGNLTINGGTITVFGPSGGANGVLDFGGSFALDGGTLLAAGTSGMSQTPSDASEQYSLAAVLETQAKAGSMVEIIVNGTTVMSGTVPKQFNYIVASSKEFTKGAEVSVAVDGKECYVGTLTETVTCFGFSGGQGGFGGSGGFGGGGRGDRGEFGGGTRPNVPNGEMPQMPKGETFSFPEDFQQS